MADLTNFGGATIVQLQTETAQAQAQIVAIETQITPVVPPIYYIDSVAGSDTNAGTTSGAPWQTIGHALSVGLTAGTTLNLKCGSTFRTGNTTTTLPAGLNITSYSTGALPIITPSILVTGWTLNSGSVYWAPCNLSGSGQMIWENGVQGIAVGSIAGITAVGEFFLDTTAHKLYYRTRGGGSPAGYTIAFDNGNFGIQTTGNNGSITNCVITECGSSSLVNTFNGGPQIGWVFTYVTFSNSASNGFGLFGGSDGTGYTFRHCVFTGNGATGFSAAACAGMLVEDCVFSSNVSTGCAFNSQLSVLNGPNVFNRCTANNNGEDGFVAGQYAINDRLVDCVAYGNGTAVDDRTGMKTFGTNTLFLRCESYANNNSFTTGHGFQVDRAGSGTPIQGTGAVFDTCSAYGNQDSGINIIGDNCTVRNCQIYSNISSGLMFSGSTVSNFTSSGNTICHNGPSSTANFQINDSTGVMFGAAGTAMDYDRIFSSASHTNLIRWGGTSYTTLATFHTAWTSFETHGIEAIG